VRLAIPTAKSKYTSVGGMDGPLAKAITKPMISLKNPKTSNTHAIIVVKALNIPGIVKPPVNAVVQAYTIHYDITCFNSTRKIPRAFQEWLFFSDVFYSWSSRGIIKSNGARMKRVVGFVSLITILLDLILSGLNDAAIPIADSELSSSVGSRDSSASVSGTVAVTMLTVTDGKLESQLVDVTSGRIIHLREGLKNMRRLRYRGNINDMVGNLTLTCHEELP
jgi:hypothetical protein